MLQIPERKQLTVPKIESPEGYYEEAEPYDTSIIGMYVPGARALRVCYNLQAGADSSPGDRQAHLGQSDLTQEMASVENWPYGVQCLVCVKCPTPCLPVRGSGDPLLYPRGSRLLPGCLPSTERWCRSDVMAEGPVEVRRSLRESFMFFLWIQLLCYSSRVRTLIWRESTDHT